MSNDETIVWVATQSYYEHVYKMDVFSSPQLAMKAFGKNLDWCPDETHSKYYAQEPVGIGTNYMIKAKTLNVPKEIGNDFK